MTKEEAKKMLPVIQAFAEGKSIEYNWDGTWSVCTNLEFCRPLNHYRIKPEPKLRPWKPEEVPVGAIIRGMGDYRQSLILGKDCCGFKAISHGCQPILVDIQVSEIGPGSHEYSTDGGKTWLPCGVQE